MRLLSWGLLSLGLLFCFALTLAFEFPNASLPRRPRWRPSSLRTAGARAGGCAVGRMELPRVMLGGVFAHW